MSLIDSNDNLSMGPLSVLTTVPVGAGPPGRGPLGPLTAGSPPTRNGSLSIDSARPSTTVVHPATTSVAAAQAIAALTAWLNINGPRLDRPHGGTGRLPVEVSGAGPGRAL